MKYSTCGLPSACASDLPVPFPLSATVELSAGRSSRIASASKVFEPSSHSIRAGFLPVPGRFALSEDCDVVDSGEDCGTNPSGALRGAYRTNASFIFFVSMSLSLSLSLLDSLASMCRMDA